MYIPKELRKLNEFQEVRIPSNREFFTRHGSAQVPPSQYTGDEMAPMPSRKVDTLADMEEFDRIRQKEEASSKNSD